MSKLTVIAEPQSHAIQMTRSFDAPRELVFKAYTDPEMLAQWWGGPDGSTTHIDQLDVRKGGVWRFVERDADGNEYAFNGVFHEIQAPERIVYTFEFEGMPGHVLLETLTFEEQDGKTVLTDHSVFQSVADRDGMMSYGMEDGAAASFNRLEALVTKAAQ